MAQQSESSRTTLSRYTRGNLDNPTHGYDPYCDCNFCMSYHPAAYERKRKRFTIPKNIKQWVARYIDHDLDGMIFSTATLANPLFTVQLLNPIPQGVTQSSRIGKKVRLKSIQVRGWIARNNDTNPPFSDVVLGALLIVYDSKPTGSMPLATDVLTSQSIKAMNNDSNANRFQMLHRELIRVDWGEYIGTTLTNFGAEHVEFYKEFNYKWCEFKALGTGAIDDISKGAVYAIAVGQGQNNTATLFANSRIVYLDEMA